MKFYDAFSGIGGFHLGIKQAHPNWQCSGACEIDKHAASVYKRHFNGVNIDADIRKVEKLPTGTDLFCGGFPCQDLSVAGKRKGLVGERSGLFYEIIRLAAASKPKMLFLENVKGLDGEPMFTLNTQDRHGVVLRAGTQMRIRRLMPIECERLQGFPEGWTKHYAGGKEVSDSQRYKMLGNAVTVPVIRRIAERLI